MRPLERHLAGHVECLYPLIKRSLVYTFTETTIKLLLLEWARAVLLKIQILDTAINV